MESNEECWNDNFTFGAGAAGKSADGDTLSALLDGDAALETDALLFRIDLKIFQDLAEHFIMAAWPLVMRAQFAADGVAYLLFKVFRGPISARLRADKAEHRYSR